MLTTPSAQITGLLSKASRVAMAQSLPLADDAADEAQDADDFALDDWLADDPAYQELLHSLDALSAEAIHELLALSLFGRNDGLIDEWQIVRDQAKMFRKKNILDELTRTLLLTDDIETALDRLAVAVSHPPIDMQAGFTQAAPEIGHSFSEQSRARP